MSLFEYLSILALAMLCIYLLGSALSSWRRWIPSHTPKENLSPMPNKQSKRFKHEIRKSKQIKRFKPAVVRLREKREAAVAQEAKARYQYHQLRLRSSQQ